jgi:hypothetical protein
MSYFAIGLQFFQAQWSPIITVPVSNSLNYSMAILKSTRQWQKNTYRKCIFKCDSHSTFT